MQFERPTLLGVLPTCRRLGISRTTVYDLMGRGLLDARKIGGRTVITMDSIEALAASLPRAPIKDRAA